MKESTNMDAETRQAESVNLLKYVREYAKLKQKTVASLDSYDDVFWLADIPRQPECHFAAWDDGTDEDLKSDNWITVQRPDLPAPPAPPEQVMPWIDESRWLDSSREVPELLERALNPAWTEQDPDAVEQFLELTDFPEIQTAWDDYIEAEWWDWAENDRQKSAVNECYRALFQLHRSQLTTGEQFEFILAVGCLHCMDQNGKPVKRHLLTLPVTIEFDALGAVVSVVSAGNTPKVTFETDMLQFVQRPVGIEEDAEARCQELGDNLFDPAAHELLRFFVQGFSDEGTFDNTLDKVGGSNPANPKVTLSPALIVRRRNQRNLVAVCKNMLDQLEGAEATVPATFRKIIGELDVDDNCDMDAGEDECRSGHRAGDSEVYFPLPSNKEQLRILERMKNQSGVLVLGPPGTGKSQTIANLMCQLLAEGKRILVTSHKAAALKVLRDKLPEPIADLCIMILGQGAEEQLSLSKSVAEISGRHSDWNLAASEEQVAQLRKELTESRTLKAKIFESTCAIREKETFQHSQLFGNYEGSLQEIVTRVRSEDAEFAWLDDRLSDDTSLLTGDSPILPVSSADLLALVALLKSIDPRYRGRCASHLPELDAVPEPEALRTLIATETHLQNERNRLQAGFDEVLCGSTNGLPDNDLDDLIAVLDTIHEERQLFENMGTSWMDGCLEDVFQDRGASWKTLRDSSGKFLNAIHEVDESVLHLKVRGLDDRPLDAVRTHAIALKAHLDAGGHRGFLMFRAEAVRQAMYLIQQVKVDGELCRTAEPLAKLIDYLGVCLQLEGLREQWCGVRRREADELPLNQEIASCSEDAGRLARVIDFGNLVKSNNARFAHADFRLVEAFKDRDYSGGLRASLQFIRTQRQLAQATSDLDALAERIENAVPEDDADVIKRDLVRAISSRDADEYTKRRTELSHLWNARRQVAESEQMFDSIRSSLPLLADQVQSSCEDPAEAPAWEERLLDIDSAWNWMCADRWVREMLAPAARETLDWQMGECTSRESEILTELAAALAWQHRLSNLSERDRQSLVAWRKSHEAVGKGTGRHAERKRRIAMEHMEKCRDAVPAWVMPFYKVLETIRVAPEIFDVVIIDEASQSGPEALILAYLARQVVIVGDDQQIRPENVGVDESSVHQLQDRFLGNVPHRDLFGSGQSLFSIAEVRFSNPVRLREHYRCMPEIISFCNRLCYQDQPLIPLKQFGSNRLQPMKAQYVEGGYQDGRGVNPREVERIVAAIEQCCKDPAYAGKTFGVISLLHSSDQAAAIERAIIKRIPAEEIDARNIVCGDAYDFQGDDRDVIFLSMVSARSDTRRIGTLSDQKAKRRFNVAVSRAKEQLWLFHSVQENELSPRCFRRSLLNHVRQPETPAAVLPAGVESVTDLRLLSRTVQRGTENSPKPFDSWFEVDVFLDIAEQGFAVTPQYPVHDRRIDLVVTGGSRKLAVECYGDYWHGPEKFEEDLYRQKELERCGWEFVIILESSYRNDPAGTLSPLWEILGAPEFSAPSDEPEPVCESIPVAEQLQGPVDAVTVIPPTESAGDPMESVEQNFFDIEPPDDSGGNNGTTVNTVLGLPNPDVGKVVCEILSQRPHYSLKKSDLITHVCRHFGIRTRGGPRRQLDRKLGQVVQRLRKNGVIEKYKSKNDRIRLLNPPKQRRLL